MPQLAWVSSKLPGAPPKLSPNPELFPLSPRESPADGQPCTAWHSKEISQGSAACLLFLGWSLGLQAIIEYSSCRKTLRFMGSYPKINQYLCILNSVRPTFIPDAQGTTCDQRLEHISGTHHSRILRVPFRDDSGILQHWVSRCAPLPAPSVDLYAVPRTSWKWTGDMWISSTLVQLHAQESTAAEWRESFFLINRYLAVPLSSSSHPWPGRGIATILSLSEPLSPYGLATVLSTLLYVKLKMKAHFLPAQI